MHHGGLHDFLLDTLVALDQMLKFTNSGGPRFQSPIPLDQTLQVLFLFLPLSPSLLKLLERDMLLLLYQFF